jgi:hypothetical protein
MQIITSTGKRKRFTTKTFDVLRLEKCLYPEREICLYRLAIGSECKTFNCCLSTFNCWLFVIINNTNKEQDQIGPDKGMSNYIHPEFFTSNHRCGNCDYNVYAHEKKTKKK